jgi:hypothetical protein
MTGTIPPSGYRFPFRHVERRFGLALGQVDGLSFGPLIQAE